MLDGRSSRIIPVPDCLIGEEKVLKKLKDLYQDELWLSIAPKKPDRGHVEIYQKESDTNPTYKYGLTDSSDIQLNWNQEYASGGFTQVFQEMNEKLRLEIADWYGDGPESLLDLFAGNGNISNNLSYSARLCVDIYTEPKGSEFFSQSLYEEKALARVMIELKKKNISPDVLILDPPRSGLIDLNKWLAEIGPKRVAYVSCDPHTMARDLQRVSGYQPTGALLLDFFPSTFHFESLIFLERK